MTTQIKIKPSSHSVLVETFDKSRDTKYWETVDRKILKKDDPEQTFYCTTTRRITIGDIESGGAG